MPLGLVRLNERHQRPNQNISFIRPMDGPDKEIVQDILERVSAIVWPIMRDNHLGVMTLEDFPANREFLGRNFNAGEVIQLVLKSYTTGQWLPFSFVCTVMLHELAHIKHMNHSKYFHQVRIGYHKEYDALIARHYTGEGFWSKGQAISAEYTAPRHLSEAEMPENLCGGTYRTAQKPQKRKLTYAEQRQKRKERLFGKGEGEMTGGDEKLRASLEKGKSKKAVATKPRVAQSQRGRDLRLEAALKRQQAQKDMTEGSSTDSGVDKKEFSDEDDNSEYETDEQEETVDVGGGNRLVRIDEQGDDDEEWDELRDEMSKMLDKSLPALPSHTSGTNKIAADSNGKGKAKSMDFVDPDKSIQKAGTQSQLAFPSKGTKAKNEHSDSPVQVDDGSATDASSSDDLEVLPADPSSQKQSGKKVSHSEDEDTPPPPVKRSLTGAFDERKNMNAAAGPISPDVPDGNACSVCTTLNGEDSALCMTCANVLHPETTPYWKCKTPACQGSDYANSEDAGICGCCGERRNS